jgi:hypothetical protein
VPSLRERANRRERAIEQFRERQRVVRHWISLSDLADWCAALSMTAGIVEQKKGRDLALQSLAASIRTGEFEGRQRRGNDGSQILFLAPYVVGEEAPPRCRLTRGQFAYVYEADPDLSSTILAQLWVLRDLARYWLEAHGYRWPPHFNQLVPDDRSYASEVAKHRPPSRKKPFWPAAREAAVEWLTDNGYPVPGDGNQAELERYVTAWLENHGHEASESAVRRHVVGWIEEYRKELGV